MDISVTKKKVSKDHEKVGFSGWMHGWMDKAFILEILRSLNKGVEFIDKFSVGRRSPLLLFASVINKAGDKETTRVLRIRK